MESVDDMLRSIFDSNGSKWKPSDKIPLLIKEIEAIKAELKLYLDNSGYDVAAILKESNELCEEAKDLTDKMELCREEIEQVTMAEVLQSIENHNRIVKELQSIDFALNIVKDVIQCGKYAREFNAGREAKSYTKAVEAVYNFLLYVENPSEGVDGLELYVNTKNSAEVILDSLLQELYDEWGKMVQWNVKPSTRKTIITITLDMLQTNTVVDILNALEKSQKLKEKVFEFGDFLLKEVLIPIIHKECLVYSETETDDLMTVTVIHKLNDKPEYDAVISNLRLLFHYLSNKLNVQFNNNNNAMTIMKMMGNEIYEQFSNILVKDCLINTIPYTISDLQTYGRITSEIESFQHFLVSMKFFPENDFSILQYVDNIDILFANKSSEYFLQEARSIMLQDLSTTMSIGVESIPNEEDDNSSKETDENSEQALQILDATIPKSLFYFPRCMISKSAQELLDLVYGIMEQAVQCSDVVSKKLYNTTRLVFELYDAVVPYHHENYLQTIPQYVALFHNNCLYLAHNLQTFGDKWLILMEGRELDYPISFVDLVQKLRNLGYKHLMIHMQQQRKQILDNIRSSDLNCIVVKDVLSDNAEAAVRQCLRQLHLLKNVWIGVFPSNVFTRLIATLVNMFVEELIHRVCTVEDISMEMATQLTDMYSLVVQKAPQLFQSPNDIETHVKSWMKLQELIFVLGGSLKDIENHWSDGTGPLAVHFKIEELRSLIKALFQNTQFRANLLSKIK